MNGFALLDTAERRYGEWAGDRTRRFRPSTTASRCPRVVAGRRCRLNYRGACICERHRWFLDHARLWLDPNGRHVLTCEPYEAEGDELVAFADELRELGLSFTVVGYSPWNPGGTFLVVVERAEGVQAEA
jgi:hypothetical protein